MRDARYKVVVDVKDAAGAETFAKLMAAPDWRLDPVATAAAPGDLSVLGFERPGAAGDVASGMTAVRRALGTDDLAGAGVTTEFVTQRPDGGDGLLRVMAIASGDQLGQILGSAFPAPQSVVVQVGTPAADAPATTQPKPPATDKAAAAAATEAKAPTAGADGNGASGGSGAEATIAAVETVLGDPEGIWAHLAAGKDELAAEQIRARYADRAEFARRSQWALSPELALLDLVTDDEERSGLASDVLKVRANLTVNDESVRASHADLAAKRVDLEGRRVELEGKRVELEGKRVALAHEGVETAREMRRHMEKWRKLAGLAPWFLGFTTTFAMLAIAYMVLKVLPDDDVADATVPIAIFALAVFAISPAVLLLLERPLKGIDEWVPGSKPATDAPAAPTPPATAPAATAPTATTPTATTPAATTPAGAPGSPS
jgi:hypothetical protein